QHAGTYSFNVRLNSKWGVWSSDFINDEKNAGYFTATVTVARKQIDYPSLSYVPKFANANDDAFTLHGAETPIYRYNDGWYVAQKAGEEPIETRTVTNSFAYYNKGLPIKIKLVGEQVIVDDHGVESTATLGDVLITSRNGLEFAPSAEYMASYEFRVKLIPNTTQSDYIFNYGTDSNTKYNNVTDATTGLSMTAKQDFSFRLTKRWFIVVQTNMFVVNGLPYAPLTNSEVHYTDDVTAQIPSLNYGNEIGTIDFEIAYTPIDGRAVTIRPRVTIDKQGTVAANTIGYYINSSMPAGAYTLKLYGSAVTVPNASDGTSTSYSEISGEYHFTVAPKEFNATAIRKIHETVRGKAVTGVAAGEKELNKYINEYPLDNKALHASVNTDDMLKALNATLASDISASGTNYWTELSEEGKALYYSSEVAVLYNLEGSGNTIYSNYNTMLASLGSANTYTLYYSISAKNYVTVGGADSEERQTRGFRTTLYTDIKVSEIYKVLLDDVDSPYFQNVPYTGQPAYTSVQPNQYYSYAFDENLDYVNAGKVYVTLTLYNAGLAHWNDSLSLASAENPNGFTQEEINKKNSYFEVINGGRSLKVYYHITPATNSWSVVPQMPSWTYNGFKDSVNFITAGLAFPGANYRFALIPKSVSPAGVTFNSSAVKDVNGIVYFTVDANGVVNGTEAQNTLKTLVPGDYYLKSFIDGIANERVGGTGNNVEGFTFIPVNAQKEYFTTVTITPATNTWEITPGLTVWVYRAFDDGNFREGVPVFGKDRAITYTLYEGDRSSGSLTGIASLISFETLDDNVTVNGKTMTVSEYFKQLDVLSGNRVYTLVASLGETENYGSLDQRVTFSVLPVQNTWKETPRLTSFQYNGFSAETNFIGGEATYPEDGGTVYYAILKNVPTTPKSLTEFKALNALKFFTAIDSAMEDYLDALGNGTYYFAAYAEGATNYSDLFSYTTFSVSDTGNNWKSEKIPSISGWTYGAYNTSFTKGEAEFGTVLYSVQNVNDDGNPIANSYASVGSTTLKNLKYDDIKDLFASLGAGRYMLAASVTATDDYGSVSHNVFFSVAKATNAWDGDAPSMQGWTYSEYDATKNKPNAAQTVVNTGKGITYKYYTAVWSNGEWISVKEIAAADLKTADAGTYILVATAVGNDNYFDLVHSTTFEISKFQGEWNVEPEHSLSWVWGVTASTITNSRLYKAAVKQPADAEILYTITGVDVTYSAEKVTKTNLLETLRKLSAGTYDVNVFVNTDELPNYTYESYRMQITVSAADFVVGQHATSAGWTWGATNKEFAKIVVSDIVDKTLTTVPATVQYRISVGDGWTSWSDYDTMVATLYARPVGTYTVEVSVAYDVDGRYYNAVTEQITVKIGAAEFAWDTGCDPASKSWTWDWNNKSNTAKESAMVAFSAHGVGGVNAVLNIAVSGSATGTYSSFLGENGLKAFLLTADAGTYTVTVTVVADTNTQNPGYLLSNYKDFSVTFTVTVNQAKNKWGLAPVSTTYTKEYLTDLSPALRQATADFGTVVYTDGNGLALTYLKDGVNKTVTDAATLNEYINNLASSTTPYTIITKVDGTDNYAGLPGVVTYIKVNGIGSSWVNEGELTSSQQLTYTDGLRLVDGSNGKTGNVIIPIGNAEKGATKYDLSYHDYNNGNVSATENSVDYGEVFTWLNSRDAVAGTYVIHATYKPNDGNYATIEYEVTLTVARATVSWAQELNDEYRGAYGLIEVPTPSVTVAGCTVPVVISIVDNNNNVYEIPEGKTLSDYVKELGVVDRYTVTYSVAATLNYSGLSAKVSRLYITPVINSWKDTKDGSGKIVISSSQWADGYGWTGSRANLSAITVAVPEPVIGTVTVSIDGAPATSLTAEELNTYLRGADLSADRVHTLVFTVRGTANYNELVSRCTLQISKIKNDWKSGKAPKDYEFNGTVNTSTFVVPEAQINAAGTATDLIRYDIEKIGGTGSGNLYGRTRAQFNEDIKTLANGMYVITARVGGALPAGIDPGSTFASNWELYNKDYESLVGTLTITLTPNTNGWTTAFSGNEWTWGIKVNGTGSTVTVARPVATHGNDTIKYTVSGKDANGTSVRETFAAIDYPEKDGKSPAVRTFEALIEYLNGLNAGTYTVTASIAATDTYNAPTDATVLFTIDKVTTAWTSTSPEDGLRTEWKYNDSNNQMPVAPTLANFATGSLTYTLTKDADSVPLYSNGSVWSDMLAILGRQSAGTYVITTNVVLGSDANHLPLSHTQTVVISAYENSWDEENTTGSGNTVVQIEWTYGDTQNNPEIKFTPNYNAEKLVITVNGTKVPVADLGTYLASLDATPEGTVHTIVASVDADTMYTGITRTVTLNISKAKNKWTTNLGIVTKSGETADIAANRWTWDNITIGAEGQNSNQLKFKLTAPAPAQGNRVTITVYYASTDTEAFSYTLRFVDDESGGKTLSSGDLYTLYNRILGLGAGSYEMVASVAYNENYDSLTSARVKFVIAQVANSWESFPKIDRWDFGGTTAYPSSKAKYGAENVVYDYAKVLDGETTAPNAGRADWVQNLPFQAGSYWLRATVAETTEYSGLTYYVKFTIGQGENSWVENPGVIAWAWNSYDPDVNLFSGSARSNGTVTFTIYRGLAGNDADGNPNRTALTLNDFKPYNDFKADADKLIVTEAMLTKLQKFELTGRVVSAAVAKLLNALKPGSYVIYATAESGESLADIDGYVRFVVNNARNDWTTDPDGESTQAVTPNVISFEHGKFKASDFTAGITKYGQDDIRYRVTGTANLTQNADVDSGENGMTAEEIEEFISTLRAGSYFLKVWVIGETVSVYAEGTVASESDYTYEAFYTKLSPYTVQFNVTRSENDWKKDKEPVASISSTREDLLGMTKLDDWFALPEAVSGTEVTFTIFTNEYKTIEEGLTYNGENSLLAALKEIGYGSFIIRSNVAQSCDYTAIYGDTSLLISRHGNNFRNLPQNNTVTGTWKENGNELTFAEVTADYGNVVYTLLGKKYRYNGSTEEGFETFGIYTYLLRQNAGVYNVAVSVDGTDDYEGLASTTIRVDINAAQNKWQNGWEADSSLNVASTYENNLQQWKWNSTVDWIPAKPTYGNIVYVEIRVLNTEDETEPTDALHYITVDYSLKDGGATAIGNVCKAISGLSVGQYTMTVTAPADNNWQVLTDSTSFEIKQTQNSWEEEGTPAILGDSVSKGTDGYYWNYGKSYSAYADALYGTVAYEYYAANKTTKLTEKPTAAGTSVSYTH
ncbi:MAG: hypothetical protein K2L87_06295, partial [Clostridiales bacterium]|nr:hypothetical protein [Clostridiales bacterium]